MSTLIYLGERDHRGEQQFLKAQEEPAFVADLMADDGPMPLTLLKPDGEVLGTAYVNARRVLYIMDAGE